MRGQMVFRVVAFAAAVLVALGLGLSGTAGARKGRWVTASGSSMQGLAPATQTGTKATVRMIARSSIAASAVRVKLENTFGLEPLTIGEAYVALRNLGARLVEGSTRRLTFNGPPSVTIPARGRVFSYGLPVCADCSLEKDADIVFNAGTHTLTAKIAFRNYLALVKPVMADFAIHFGRGLLRCNRLPVGDYEWSCTARSSGMVSPKP